MGQILHDCARTTAAVRRAIQHSQESLIALAERYDINPKTVHKWRKRSFVTDARMGPRPHSTTLSAEQEAIIVAFRKHTLLPLDDCLYAPSRNSPAPRSIAVFCAMVSVACQISTAIALPKGKDSKCILSATFMSI